MNDLRVLLIVGVVFLLAFLWVLLSPVRALQTIPDHAD